MPTILGYKQKASLHRPAFPRDIDKVGWQGAQYKTPWQFSVLMKFPAMTQSCMRLLLTSHSCEERTGEKKTSAAFADMLWSQPCYFAWQSHLPMKTPELLEKQGHSKEKYIAVSKQRKSVTGKYLAVGWGFLVQDRYSCHLKSGDSYNSAKICLKKKKKQSQYKNYSKWLGFLQHKAALTHELRESEIQGRRFYT